MWFLAGVFGRELSSRINKEWTDGGPWFPPPIGRWRGGKAKHSAARMRSTALLLGLTDRRHRHIILQGIRICLAQRGRRRGRGDVGQFRLEI
jgi:hypothetical protein